MRMRENVTSPPCTRGSWGGTCARRRCRVQEQRPLLNPTAHPGGLTKETEKGRGEEGAEQDGLPETAATLCHSIGSVGATILFLGWSPWLPPPLSSSGRRAGRRQSSPSTCVSFVRGPIRKYGPVTFQKPSTALDWAGPVSVKRGRGIGVVGARSPRFETLKRSLET